MSNHTTMEQQASEFDVIAALCESSQSIAICAHTSPDGDALGSELALAELIEQLWPNKTIEVLLADSKPCPRMYSFLKGSERLCFACEYTDTPDLFICVDLSSASRLKEAEAVMRRANHVVVLDHHPSTEHFWEAGVVRPEAAAAGVIVTEFAEHLNAVLTASMAESLLCALVTDTGRFQYQNSDAEAFHVAARLVDAGADPSEIALKVYQSDRLAYLHLESKVLGRTTTFCGGRIAYGYATAQEIDALGVDLSECEGLVDAVRRVDGADIVVFLKEQGVDHVRGSLRAKGDVDISEVAREMGGGGHKAAAGFVVDGNIDEVFSTLLPKLKALLGSNGEGLT